MFTSIEPDNILLIFFKEKNSYRSESMIILYIFLLKVKLESFVVGVPEL